MKLICRWLIIEQKKGKKREQKEKRGWEGENERERSKYLWGLKDKLSLLIILRDFGCFLVVVNSSNSESIFYLRTIFIMNVDFHRHSCNVLITIFGPFIVRSIHPTAFLICHVANLDESQVFVWPWCSKLPLLHQSKLTRTNTSVVVLQVKICIVGKNKQLKILSLIMAINCVEFEICSINIVITRLLNIMFIKFYIVYLGVES